MFKSAPLSIVSNLLFALVVSLCVPPGRAQTMPMTVPLDSTERLTPVNSKVESVTYKGRKAIRVTDTAPDGSSDDARFVIVTGSQFQGGTIEVDAAGDRL